MTECIICSGFLGEHEVYHICNLLDKKDTKLTSSASLTPCGHIFHTKCVNNWLRQRVGRGDCPICKAELRFNKLIPLNIEWSRNPEINAIAESYTHELLSQRVKVGEISSEISIIQKETRVSKNRYKEDIKKVDRLKAEIDSIKAHISLYKSKDIHYSFEKVVTEQKKIELEWLLNKFKEIFEWEIDVNSFSDILTGDIYDGIDAAKNHVKIFERILTHGAYLKMILDKEKEEHDKLKEEYNKLVEKTTAKLKSLNLSSNSPEITDKFMDETASKVKSLSLSNSPGDHNERFKLLPQTKHKGSEAKNKDRFK